MNEAIRWQLINATLNGDSHRLRVLLSKRVRIDMLQAFQLFHLAAASGSVDNLKTILAFMPTINVNSRDDVGCTALHKAASAGHREVIHFLIYHGAQVDTQEYLNGNSPLHEAASKGFSRSVEALCISRASLNIPNRMGLTPLHVAAQHGHKQSLRVLLFSGADINATDGFGNTCLHTAIRYGRVGVVKILLASSANVMAVNQNLETPLHIAASLKRTKIAKFLLMGRGSPLLMGTLSRRMDTKRQSPPFSNSTTSSYTVAAQAALWMRNVRGETPLDIARRRVRGGCGSSDMITLLLEQMNETQYENGTTKSLPRSPASLSGSGPKTGKIPAVATPYMSTNLVYPPVERKKTVGAIKLAFMSRKLARNQGLVGPNCNDTSTNHISLEADLSNLALSTPMENGLHQIQPDPNERMTSSFMNGVAAENPEYRWPEVKTNSRLIRRSLLGGLFRRDHAKTSLTGLMKKSESTFINGPGSSSFALNNNVPALKMPNSISVSAALNDSHSSSLTRRSVLKEVTLSTDDPAQQSILLGRFQQLPFPQNSASTSAGVSSVNLPEDPTASNSSEQGRNTTSSHPSTAFRNNSNSVGMNGGSSERIRQRLGVRFDLDNNGQNQHPVQDGQNGLSGPNASHGRQLSMQLYRDLAGNLKKGPAGSSTGCNCIQRQADYFAGKIPSFVPCATHSYLEFHGSATDLRNPNPFHSRKYREYRSGPGITATANKIKPWKRAHSDESLSVHALVNAQPPTNVVTVTMAPVTVTTATTSSKTSEITSNIVPVSDTCTRIPDCKPISVNYENASMWPVNRDTIQEPNEEKQKMLNGHQKMPKSKSYHGQMAASIANKFPKLTKGHIVMNSSPSRQGPGATPLYFSCRNIDGKMGLSVGIPSVGRFSPPILHPVPMSTTNGAR